MLDPTDTILALSSAPGASVRAVLRLSGEKAVPGAGAVFEPADGGPTLEGTAGHRRREGFLRVGSARVPAAVLVFRGPRSYTGEDSVELHLPGSPPVVARAVEELLRRMPGLRAAGPGEFTQRAYLNGKLDLAQAEGVLSVIRSRSAADLRAARQLLDGAVSRTAADIRARLVDLLVELEAGIDFVEEDIAFITAERLAADLRAVAATLDGLLSSRGGEVPDATATVALIGRPNVGKSRLFNALLGAPRAIVADVAGTTRDPLAGRVRIGGFDVTLTDTAGVMPADGLPEPDRLAQGATADRRAAADLCVLVFDASAGLTDADLAAAEGVAEPLIVANKCDLAGMLSDGRAGVRVSAATGEGLDALREAVAARLEAGASADRGEGRPALNARHRAALGACREAVGRAVALSAEGGRDAPTELIAAELRDAARAVGTVAGEVVADDILAGIFSRFCVGK